MQAVSVAPNHSMSDLTDIHLNTVVFFSAAFSGGSEFRASCVSPAWVLEVTRETTCKASWALLTASRVFLILSSCPGILEFDET